MSYNKYYQQENYFGDACPEVLTFFAAVVEKGSLLDLGCGQGRDAIPLARMGFEVTGIDSSQVGINHLNQIAKAENLNLIGKLGDLYAFNEWAEFDCILLDSMFHFAKADKQKEMDFLNQMFRILKPGTLVVICIQATGKKVDTLREILGDFGLSEKTEEIDFIYTFIEKSSKHSSVSPYKLISVRT